LARNIYLDIAIYLALALALAACGGNKQLYMESREAPSLQVPADLDMPNQESGLFIPGRSAPQLAGRAEARPPLVLSSEEAEQASTNIRYGDGALYLLVEDDLNSVWRRLGFTLNRAGMAIDETFPDLFRYTFNYNQPPATISGRSFWDTVFFWRNSDPINYSGTYHVELHRDSGNEQQTRVYLYGGDEHPANAEAADHLLGVIQKRLG